MSMAEYEITLTGDDLPARLNKLCAAEPGVYGKRWNLDGSLTVMIRSERQANELIDALEQVESSKPPRLARRSVEQTEPTEGTED